MKKKQVRYLEGVGEDYATTITPLSKDPSRLIADSTIREEIPQDIEEVNLF